MNSNGNIKNNKEKNEKQGGVKLLIDETSDDGSQVNVIQIRSNNEYNKNSRSRHHQNKVMQQPLRNTQKPSNRNNALVFEKVAISDSLDGDSCEKQHII